MAHNDLLDAAALRQQYEEYKAAYEELRAAHEKCPTAGTENGVFVVRIPFQTAAAPMSTPELDAFLDPPSPEPPLPAAAPVPGALPDAVPVTHAAMPPAPPDRTITCHHCGSNRLRWIPKGPHGPFLVCMNGCKNPEHPDKNLPVSERTYWLNQPEYKGKGCPNCRAPIVFRHGNKDAGLPDFIGCPNYDTSPACKDFKIQLPPLALPPLPS